MKKNPLNVIILSLIIIGLVIVGILLFIQNRQGASDLHSFTVENGEFVVKGKNLGRVEVWGVPTAPGITPDSYLHLTNMLRRSGEEGVQEWKASIPVQPLLLTEVYVRAYNPDGEVLATTSLSYKGATEIYNALWPLATTTSSTFNIR